MCSYSLDDQWTIKRQWTIERREMDYQVTKEMEDRRTKNGRSNNKKMDDRATREIDDRATRNGQSSDENCITVN